MAGITRRRLLWGLGAGLAGLAGLRFGVPRLLRPGAPRPPGPRARELVARCFEGIDRGRLWDAHVHVVGFGAGGTGCWVNPAMRSHLHPWQRFRFDLYRAGLGITDDATVDPDYIATLLRCQREANPAGRLLLLAFDQVVDEQGLPQPGRSAFYVPDEYVLRLAREHAELLAAVSIHPYRRDAEARLERAAGAGARAVKWIPSAMAIDPASPRCDAFYRRLAALDLPLLSHAGTEYAMETGGHQGLGNPLLLRRALDHGVRVIAAHCGALGSFPDLDDPARARRPSFDLFLRMFRDGRWADRLFGEISAIIHVNYASRVARELLLSSDEHSRLLYGSDYPLPALRFLTSPLALSLAGLLDPADREPCAEIFRWNPLLFDFVVKRALRVRHAGGARSFSPQVFDTARVLGRPRGAEPGAGS